jgi:hypothetical protein
VCATAKREAALCEEEDLLAKSTVAAAKGYSEDIEHRSFFG